MRKFKKTTISFACAGALTSLLLLPLLTGADVQAPASQANLVPLRRIDGSGATNGQVITWNAAQLNEDGSLGRWTPQNGSGGGGSSSLTWGTNAATGDITNGNGGGVHVNGSLLSWPFIGYGGAMVINGPLFFGNNTGIGQSGGPNNQPKFVITANGGVSAGGVTDPGAGNILATNEIYLSASTAAHTVSGNDGLLWNSNKVLYWVTSTKTNLVSDGR